MIRPKTSIEKITAWVGSPTSLLLHTVVFIAAFGSAVVGKVSWDTMLLVLTTLVSLEAIYLSIMIQMTVNLQAAELAEVSEDVEDIQEDIEEISHDVDEIQKDVDEIQGDVDEIQEDVEEITEDAESEEALDKKHTDAIEQLTTDVRRLLVDLEQLKKDNDR